MSREFYTPSGALRIGACPCGAGMDKVINDDRALCVAGHYYEIQGPDWGQAFDEKAMKLDNCMAEIKRLEALLQDKQEHPRAFNHASADECPTYFDGCNCDRATKAELVSMLLVLQRAEGRLDALVKEKQARIEQLEKTLATTVNVLGGRPSPEAEAYAYNTRILKDIQNSRPGEDLNMLQGPEAESILLAAMDRQWDKLTDADKAYIRAARLNCAVPEVQGTTSQSWDVLESKDLEVEPKSGPYICTVCNELSTKCECNQPKEDI